MIFIGEKINGTRKSIQQAILNKDKAFIEKTAMEQAQAGADYLDINAGTSPERECDDMLWLIDIVQGVCETPICVDSSSPATLKAAIAHVKQTPLVNSVNADPRRLDAFLPLIKEHECPVIALALDESKTGMPKNTEEKLQNMKRVMDAVKDAGISEDKVFMDPLIMGVATDTNAVLATLDVIRQLHGAYPAAHITGGLSNVSFGLPNREIVNRTFLTLAMEKGLDSAVVDPCNIELIKSLKATAMLLGQDKFCRAYTKAAKTGFVKK